MIWKNYTDNFSTISNGNVITKEYSMKNIGKNNFKSMIINNEKLIIVENNFTWIVSY